MASLVAGETKLARSTQLQVGNRVLARRSTWIRPYPGTVQHISDAGVDVAFDTGESYVGIDPENVELIQDEEKADETELDRSPCPRFDIDDSEECRAFLEHLE